MQTASIPAIRLGPPGRYRDGSVTTAVLPSSLHVANRSLDLPLTAVDEEFNAGDVTAFVRGEERDGFGDLIRGSRSAQRNGRRDGLDVVVQLLFRHPKAGVIARRRNDARTDRVDANPFPFKSTAQLRANERSQPGAIIPLWVGTSPSLM